MYLRPTPATVDPAVPGSTRRQQISVRASLKETTRAPAPPVKRSVVAPASAPQRERPSEPSATSSPRPPGTRPKTAMVVSPVSLTPEELQLPPGRQKQPTLLGLGAALRAPQLFEPTSAAGSERPAVPSSEPPSAVSEGPEAAASAAQLGLAIGEPAGHVDDSIDLAASDLDPEDVDTAWHASENISPRDRADQSATERSDPAAADGEAAEGSVRARRDSGIERRVPWRSAEAEDRADVEVPEDLTPMAQLLADFALKLSLGPVSRAWLPEVRRSALALLVTGEHRHETALAAVSSRLLELLPNEAPSSEGDTQLADGVRQDRPEPLIGNTRDAILHEVSRLAGLLPEWPAAAQDLAEEARRRETRVVRELLASVDGLKRDQRARLEEHMRLEELATMSAEALAEELLVPVERAQELEQLLAGYRRERRASAPDVGNTLALRLAIAELERKNDAFDDCDPEQKEAQRVSRGERRQAMTAVQLLLAERGELEQLDQLESLSFGERVERLRQWLDAACEKAY